MNRKIELNHLLNLNYIEEGGYIMKTLMSVLVLIFLTTNANANTVVNDDGRLIGYNTDIDGFLEPIKNREISFVDSNILLLGAGGASRAIIAGIKKENGKKILF